MGRVSINLPDDVQAAIDSVADEYSLSRSRIISDVLGKWIEGENLEQAVEDAIPEPTRKLAEREQKEKVLRDKQKLREKRASFKDRALGYLRKRLEGDAAYDLDEQEELTEGYKEDVEIWHDDPDTIARKKAMVDEWMEWYRMGFWAREHSETVESEIITDDVEWWFHVGRDIYRLRTHIEDVVETIEAVGDSTSGYSSQAVIDAVSKKYSVCEGAVMLLIEHMVEPGEATIQEALALGGDRLSGDRLASRVEIESADYVRSVDELPSDAVRPDGEPIEIESETDDD